MEFLSRQLKQVFNLIFEWNSFTGFTQGGGYGGPGFEGYEHFPLQITVEIPSPSPSERQQALLELRTWLEGKLPEEEIESYYEGTYAIAPPNPISVSAG
jgi:hypothetical protein